MELERYRDAMEGVPFDPELEARVLERMGEARPTPRSHRTARTSLLLAAALTVFVLSVGAVVVSSPVMRAYFGDGGGYEQSSALLDRAVTQEGWTLTLTDCVGDDRSLYLGLSLTAPEGTVLDQDSYGFKDYDLTFPGNESLLSSWGLGELPDPDPTDNRLEFMLRVHGSGKGSFNGAAVCLAIHTLNHSGAWNEEELKRESITDLDRTWDFGEMTVSYPDSTIRLTPNLPVTTLGVEATITQVDISPIGVYARIEGDALKGHHSWVPKNAPDGYYGCIEYQEITLYSKDGTATVPYDNLSGSGCSGGEDPGEPGRLTLSRTYGPLLDLSTLDHITICGVEIPLEFAGE